MKRRCTLRGHAARGIDRLPPTPLSAPVDAQRNPASLIGTGGETTAGPALLPHAQIYYAQGIGEVVGVYSDGICIDNVGRSASKPFPIPGSSSRPTDDLARLLPAKRFAVP